MVTLVDTPALVRAALHTSPGTVRLDELLQPVPDDPEAELRVRQAVDQLELDGKVKRLAIGEHIMLKPVDVDPPDECSRFESLLRDAGPPWEGWV